MVSSAAMALPKPRQSGFTLLELMIVVTVIGVLAAIAVPRFVNFQLRAKRSEAMVNLRAIATTQGAYYATHSAFVDCEASPTTPLGAQQHPFDLARPGWSALGWSPLGLVRCHYSAQVFENTRGKWVRNKARCDLDDDDTVAEWWIDLDPDGTSTASLHGVLRPSHATDDTLVF